MRCRGVVCYADLLRDYNGCFCVLSVHFNDWNLTTPINSSSVCTEPLWNDQTNKNKTRTSSCDFTPPGSWDWYILKEIMCIYILPRWIKQFFTGTLYPRSGFRSTKNLSWNNWFEKLKGKTGIRVSELWSYSNHWVNPWLTECRERGFFAVIREIGLYNTSCVWRNAVVLLPGPLKQYLNTSSCEEPCVYCGYFPRCLRSSCFVLSWS